MLDETFDKLSKLYQERDEKIGVMPHVQEKFDQFLKSRERDWELHERIAYEALELFLKSPNFKEIRHRLACCLMHPTALSKMPELLEIHNITTDEWLKRLRSYVTLAVVMIFLTVDWISIFSEVFADRKTN